MNGTGFLLTMCAVRNVSEGKYEIIGNYGEVVYQCGENDPNYVSANSGDIKIVGKVGLVTLKEIDYAEIVTDN